MNYLYARRFLEGLNLATVLLFSLPGYAGQLADGETFFNLPPTLLESATTFSEVSVPTVKYYFTISIPSGATEPLAKIVFQQQPNPDPIHFEAEKTTAFIGTQQNQGKALGVVSSWNPETDEVAVTFDPPVPPGTTISVRLIPEQNPDVPGVYQFRVLALPTGLIPQAMDLGVARFHFYRNFL